jgi:hypothetical protein
MRRQSGGERCLQLSCQRIRETIFKKKPSSNRQKPPMKSRAIQALPLPLATNERNKAINHSSSASLRITGADYTTNDLANRIQGKAK